MFLFYLTNIFLFNSVSVFRILETLAWILRSVLKLTDPDRPLFHFTIKTCFAVMKCQMLVIGKINIFEAIFGDNLKTLKDFQ
jgi:hypothetical protein